jgi:hypothetical protein
MEIVTIASPQGFTEPNIDPTTAPIWTDGVNDYLVASGPLDEYALEDGGDLIPYITSDPITAMPNRVNVVVGMNGLDALLAMGLTVKVISGG